MAFILASFYFFYFSTVGVYIIFMPKILEMTGYAPSEIGILFAASPLVRFVMPFLFIRTIKLTPKLFRAASFLVFFSSFLFFFTLEHFYLLLLTNVLLGIGMSLSIPYVESFALTHMPKEMYGKVRLFGSIGFILVALILVNFLDRTNALVFLNIATFFILVFSLFIFSLENKIITAPISDDASFPLLKHWPLWVSLFLMQVGFGGFYNFFTIYASSFDIGIPNLNISSMDMTIYLWSFGVVCEVIMLYFQAPLLKNNLLKVLQFAISLTVLRWLILALFPQNLSLLFFSQSIHAFSFALYHSAAIMYLHSLYTNKKLSQQFFAGIAYGLGGFIGASLSGFVYELSPQGLYLATAFITLMSLFFLSLERKKEAIV